MSQTEEQIAAIQAKNTAAETERAPDQTNKRTPARRLAIQAIIMTVFVVIGVYSVTMPWYTFNLPSMTVVSESLTKIPDVSAHGSVSGWDLTHQAANTPTPGMGVPLSAAPSPGSFMGLPVAAAILVVAGLFGIGTALLKQAVTGVIGVIAMPLAWKQLVTFRATIENPAFGGNFNTPEIGLTVLQVCMLVTFVILLTTTLQVLVVNHKRRVQERKEALAAGRQLPPSPLDFVRALAMPAVARMHDAMEKQADEARKKAQAEKK